MKTKYIILVLLYFLAKEIHSQNSFPNVIEVGTMSSSFSYSSTQNTTSSGDDYDGRHDTQTNHRPSTNDIIYKFIITRPMDIKVNTCGSKLGDTFIYLLAPMGNNMEVWAWNDDCIDDGDKICPQSEHSSLIIENLEAGTYYVVSEGLYQNGEITTTIEGMLAKVGHGVGRKDFPFSYTHTQNTNDCGNHYEGRPGNDVFYWFEITKPMDITISHQGSNIPATFIHLLDRYGNRIAYFDYREEKGPFDNSALGYLKITDLLAGFYTVVSEGYINGYIKTTIEGSFPKEMYTNTNYNHIYTRTYTNDTGTQYFDQIQYFDGLGRPTQVVQREATPSRADLITFQEYDAFGRKSAAWLPVSLSQNNGWNVDKEIIKELSDNQYNDSNPYHKTIYEPSPLNRITEQYGPGQAWHSNGKSVKSEYLTNTTSTELNCRLYSVVGSGSTTTVKYNSDYPSSQLFVTKITDEDGNISFEFKDKLGQVILTRQKNGAEYYDTYYVYDDFGNLCYVLPPMCGNVSTGSDDMIALKRYAYIYKYDERNRCIKKRLPGCDWIYYVYDKADRLILSQDGEQRIENEWEFTKYDAFGRKIIFGIHNMGSKNHDQIRAEYKNALVVEERSTGDLGYTWNTIPGTNRHSALIVNYYDDYNFPGVLNYRAESGFDSRHGSNTDKVAAKGLLTGTRVNIMDDSGKFNHETYYYDYRGRLIQTQERTYTNGTNAEYIAYNFTGQPVEKKTYHSESILEYDVYERYRYTYDHAGRLLTTKHQLNDENYDKREVLLYMNTYDELGRLKENIAGGHTELEMIYTYNIRSWITEMQSPVFSQKLYYNTAFNGGKPNYNGNISSAIWGEYLGYNYFYDNLSRLTKSDNFLINDDGGISWGAYDTRYSYDKNGNMASLYRIEDLNVEDLKITNNGNQLSYVTDMADDDRSAFNNYSNVTNPLFKYNSNGAMTKDPYKGMEVTYDYLGMPLGVRVPAVKGSIEYMYSATGQKQEAYYRWHTGLSLDPVENTNRPQYQQPNANLRRRYIKNKIHENGSLKRILTENGYIDDGNYYFYLKDHLGNNSIVADANANVKQRMYYYPFGKPIGNDESMNQSFQPYKFGDKEYDTMLGVNLMDFEARQLDAAIPRFTTMDPLAEKYYSISPYAYVANNPLKYIDPDGKQIGFPMNTPFGTPEQIQSYVVQRKATAHQIHALENHLSPDAITIGGDFSISALPASMFIGVTVPLQGDKAWEPHLNLGLGMSANSGNESKPVSFSPKMSLTHTIGADADFKPQDMSGISTEVTGGYRGAAISVSKSNNLNEPVDKKMVYDISLSTSESKGVSVGAAMNKSRVISFKDLYDEIHNYLFDDGDR